MLVAEAAKKILDESNAQFKLCQVDMGSEFKGPFKRLMESRNIHCYSTYSDLKASIIERLNKTFKNRIYKRMALRGSLRYIDVLPDIVSKYNDTYHRTIKMKPNQVNTRNEKLLLETVYNYPRPLKQPKFSLGDYVRISNKRHVFSRGFHPSFTPELFRIHAINPKYPVTYKLSDYYGEEIIKGSFYEEELQKTKNHDVFLVEKILRRRGNKVLIRWLGYGPEHDTWEEASNFLNAEN